MKKKRNKNKANDAVSISENEADTRAEKEGKYLSQLGEKELVGLQKRKTIFMLLSTLFFALSLFMPVMGREKLFQFLWLTTLYVIFDVTLILFSVYVSYQGFKKHKIRVCIYGADAPRRGFNRQTYTSYELFNGLHFAMVAIEITVSCLTVEVWGILNIVAVIASAVFSLLSRQVLYRANANLLDFLPPKPASVNGQDEKAAPCPTHDAANKNESNAKSSNVNTNGKTAEVNGKDEKKESAAEDFYEN